MNPTRRRPPFSPDYKIISSNADAFLGGGHYSDGATLARQMFDQKANMNWVSILVAPGDDKFAELGRRRWAYRAVAVGGPDFLQAAIRTDQRTIRQGVPDQIQRRQGRLSHGLGLPAASSCSMPSSRRIREPDKGGSLNATDVTTFFGHIKFATDPGHHGSQTAHEMVLAQWQKVNGKPGR